jgi:hypothetical protein
MKLMVLVPLAGVTLVAIMMAASLAWEDRDKSAQATPALVVGFDMDPTGNSCPGDGVTDCTLGTIDPCVEVPSGGGVITVDVFLDGLPNLGALQPDEGGIVSFAYHIGEKYGNTVGTLTAYTHTDKTINLLEQQPTGGAPNHQEFSEPTGTSVPCWDAQYAELGDVEYNPNYTKGVLSRLTINTAGRPDGYYYLTLDSVIVGDAASNDYCEPTSSNYQGCDIKDANSTPQLYGLIAIGVSCEAAPTPIPPPSPTPTPTPTTGPSPAPTPTTSPTPAVPGLVAGWNHACYLGADLPISEALAELGTNVLAVYRLRPDQGYDKWFPNRPDVSTIATVSPYEALLILMANEAPWPQEPATAAPTGMELVQGWNSACYWGQTKDVQSATAGIAGQYEVLYLLTPGQGWKRFIPARPEISNLAELERFAAVLMLVTQPDGAHWVLDP